MKLFFNLLILMTMLFLLLVIPAVIPAVDYNGYVKKTIDAFANSASVYGFWLSLLGFCWTLWTVAETLQLNKRAQEKLESQLKASRTETNELLTRIRGLALSGVREQVAFFTNEALHAIRNQSWIQVADHCKAASHFSVRLLSSDLPEGDHVGEIRDAVIQLDIIRKKSLQCHNNVAKPLPETHANFLESYRLTLTKLDSTIHKNVMEDVNGD